MKTLQLTIKSKWFNLILSGQKTDEYRDIKDYWEKRLISNYDELIDENGEVFFIDFDAVQFTNGYGKDKPTATFECKGIEIGKGNKELGAPDQNVFIIKLGKELSRNNIKI